MRIECPTCQATYKVGDDKVAGKLVKIRCKACGAVIAIDGREPEPPAPALTGERNESSVLFSLAMLTRPSPDPVAPPPPSVPVASIAMLSAGDPFAPVLAAPAIPNEAEPRRSSRTNLAIGAAVVFGLLFVATAVFAAVHVARAERPAVPATTIQPVAIVTTAPTATIESIAPIASASTSSSPAPLPSVNVHPAIVTRAPIASATQQAEAPKCCPNESPSACAMRRSVGAACTDEAHPFDRNAASQALGAIDVSSCKKDSGGSGHVKITFDPSGAVTAATVDSSSFNPAVDRCVEQRFRSARAPAFTGSPITVGKTFTIKS